MAASVPLIFRVAANLTELRSNLAEMKLQLETTKASMERMTKAFDGSKLIADGNALVAVVEGLGGASKLTEAEQRRVNATLQESLAKYKVLGREAPASMLALEKATAGAVRETEKASMSASRFGVVAGVAFAAAQAGLRLLMTGVRSLGSAFVAGAIDMNATLESSTLRFAALMGDADRAREHIKDLFEIAKKTPFETGPIIEASKFLEVYGGAALNTRDNIIMMGNASAATGAPIEELGRALGRLYSSLQRGEPVGEAMEAMRRFGIITPEVTSKIMAATGSVEKGRAAWDAFTESMGRFGGAMEAQASTWAGVVSTFKDSASMLIAEGFRPMFEMLRDSIKKVNAYLESDEAEAGIERLAVRVKGAVLTVSSVIMDDIIPALSTMVSVTQSTLDTARDLWQSIPSPIRAVAVAIGEVTAALYLMNIALGALRTSGLLLVFAPMVKQLSLMREMVIWGGWGGMRLVFAEWAASLSVLLGPLAAVVGGFAVLKTMAGSWRGAFEDIGAFITGRPMLNTQMNALGLDPADVAGRIAAGEWAKGISVVASHGQSVPAAPTLPPPPPKPPAKAVRPWYLDAMAIEMAETAKAMDKLVNSGGMRLGPLRLEEFNTLVKESGPIYAGWRDGLLEVSHVFTDQYQETLPVAINMTDEIREAVEAAKRPTEEWRDRLRGLSDSFRLLSQTAGASGLGRVAGSLANVTGSLRLALDASDSLESSFDDIGKGGKAAASGMIGVAAAAAQIAAAMEQATQSTNKWENALSGAAAGASFGASVGGGYGAVAGGIAGFLYGYFKNNPADDVTPAMRAEWVAQYGGASSLKGMLAAAGASLDDYNIAMAAGEDELEAFAAAVKGVAAALQEHQVRIAAYTAAAEGTLTIAAGIDETTTQAQFERLGVYAGAIFGNLLLETGSVADAFKALGPTLDAIQVGRDTFGLTTTGIMNEMLELYAVLSDDRATSARISGLSQIGKALGANEGQLLAASGLLPTYGADIQELFAQLTGSGLATEKAWMLLQGPMQALYSALSRTDENGIPLFQRDPSLAGLMEWLSPALEAGFVGAWGRDIGEQQLGVLKEIRDVLVAANPELAVLPWTLSRYNPGIPPPVDDPALGYDPNYRFPGWANGTDGFQWFGSGTPSMLHNWERVQTPSQARAELISGGGPVTVQVYEIHAVDADGFEQLMARKGVPAFTKAVRTNAYHHNPELAATIRGLVGQA